METRAGGAVWRRTLSRSLRTSVAPLDGQQIHTSGAQFAEDRLQKRGAPGQAGEVADDHAAQTTPADVGQEAAQRWPVGIQPGPPGVGVDDRAGGRTDELQRLADLVPAGRPGLVVGRRPGVDGVRSGVRPPGWTCP